MSKKINSVKVRYGGKTHEISVKELGGSSDIKQAVSTLLNISVSDFILEFVGKTAWILPVCKLGE